MFPCGTSFCVCRQNIYRNVLFQNPPIGYYLALFSHIQNLVQCLHMQKPSILAIIRYSELLHNFIQKHIYKPAILTKIYEYSEL